MQMSDWVDLKTQGAESQKVGTYSCAWRAYAITTTQTKSRI